MKVSLICTVYNEENNIAEFLTSFSGMTRSPDELVIVDAGSMDRTVEIIKAYAVEANFPVKVLVEHKCNIARGRNLAIANAEYDIIAVTDAGCKADTVWLEEIIKPFADKNIDVVSGWYEPDARTFFENAVAMCTFPDLLKLNSEEFLPSSRSIAFRKQAWKDVEGYPEWLSLTAEDTLFDLNLKRMGKKFYFNCKAFVFWRPRPTLWGVLRQFYLYGYGDGEANIFTHSYVKTFIKLGFLLVAISIAVMNPLTGFLILLLILGDFTRNMKKNKFIYLIPAVFIRVLINCTQVVGWLNGSYKLIKNCNSGKD